MVITPLTKPEHEIFLVWSCVDKKEKSETAILSDYLDRDMIYKLMYLPILSKYWILVFINMHLQKFKVDIMQVQC